MASFCMECGTSVDEAKEATEGRSPCPKCGSLRRSFEEVLMSTATIGSFMNTKGYAAGLSKSKGLRFESKDGDSYNFDLKRFVKVSQLVDHENNRYIKKVVDPVTGETLRDVDKPLNEHQGHGDAKP